MEKKLIDCLKEGSLKGKKFRGVFRAGWVPHIREYVVLDVNAKKKIATIKDHKNKVYDISIGARWHGRDVYIKGFSKY